MRIEVVPRSTGAAPAAVCPVRIDGQRCAAGDAFGYSPVRPDRLKFVTRARRRRVLTVLPPRRRRVDFEGRDRLIAVELDALRHIPVMIGLVVGNDKIDPTVAEARPILQPAGDRSVDGEGDTFLNTNQSFVRTQRQL